MKDAEISQKLKNFEKSKCDVKRNAKSIQAMKSNIPALYLLSKLCIQLYFKLKMFQDLKL